MQPAIELRTLFESARVFVFSCQRTVIEFGRRSVDSFQIFEFSPNSLGDCAAQKSLDQDSGDWRETVAVQADVTISGSCLEHMRRPWEWIRQVASITKPNGLVVVIAPWQWPIHEHPARLLASTAERNAGAVTAAINE